MRPLLLCSMLRLTRSIRTQNFVVVAVLLLVLGGVVVLSVVLTSSSM